MTYGLTSHLLRPAIFAGVLALSTGGCATGPERLESVTHEQDCAGNEGVTLVSDEELRLSLGVRPTAGYGIHFRQGADNGYVRVNYREITPPKEQFAAQIVTSPCVRIPLRSGWHQIEVINDDNGQMWEFRAQPVPDKGL